MKNIVDVTKQTLANLSEDQLKVIAASIQFDLLKEEMRNEVEKVGIEFDKELRRFLAQKSPNTTKVYGPYIRDFNETLTKLNQHFLDVDYRMADYYVNLLNNSGLSSASIKVRIAAVSSFYTQLHRYGLVSLNPFKGCSILPEKRRKKELYVPTDEDINMVKSLFEEDLMSEGKGSVVKIRAANKMLPVIHVLRKYGLRIGAIPGIKILSDNRFVTNSKGKEVRGTFDEEDIRIFESYGLTGPMPFSDMKKPAMQLAISKKTGGKFSAHSYRHRFAVDLYTKTKDIYLVMRKLNHSSTNITTEYLRSLDVEV